jgi:dipeptidyl aminopeptidase/acylaminoacyl peptidase
VQYFVQHGYVILQPNIRGSSGYGKEFEEANNKCWGKCDLEDVLAGVEYLRTLPFVDANKIAITGQSYGGMMTMAAVVNAPDVFQAAIAEGGKLDWTEGGSDFNYELGPLPENYDLRWNLSPVNHVDKIKTPTFIICGEREGKFAPDFKLCVEKLKEFNKVYKFKAYPDEGHYVHKLENRRQMLLDKLEFYEKYLKDKK